MKRISFCLVLLATVGLLTTIIGVLPLSAEPESAANDRMIEFKGRQINLEPYFEGFPFSGFRPFYDSGNLYYFMDGQTRTLRRVSLRGKPNLAKGQIISTIDFSTRNVWSMKYHKASKKLFWIGDEKNDEIINLYSLNPSTKEITQHTDVPYIFGWDFDLHQNYIAFVARLGHLDERLGELRVLDLRNGVESLVMQDTPNMRFTWTSVSWQPEGKGVVVTVLKEADRNQGNLAYIDFETKSWTILTNFEIARNWPSAEKEWLNNEDFIYTSNEDGFVNAYRFNLPTMTSTQVTHFSKDIGDLKMFGFNGRQYIFAVLESPEENTLIVVDPMDGKILQELQVPLNVSILDSKHNDILVSCTSATSKFQIDEIKVDPRPKYDGFKFKRQVDIPEGLQAKIVHAQVSKIEYPTFDIDPITGETRKLHAFLYTPENPLPEDERMVMIQSFYGGSNSFSSRNQILAEAGIYVFSPSPRGSSGFGREFSALNDRDLGGNEIIDIIYAARFVEQSLGIPPERIGVFGGSHGGYATMRLLTFPGEINGNKADFDWGFGMSHAGFSSIIEFYENCNIPDWVIMEAGDPVTEKAKLDDRSPINHADKARGKLLLTHGTNDSRVPISGSRAMADSLRKYDKDVTLIEFEGQGHGIKGLERQIKFYRTWFEFLDTVSSTTRASAN